MNTLEALETRRSCRAYTSEPVAPELIDQIIKAGTYAPTGMGRQSPIIVAITNIATGAGAMSADIASLLVAAGGLTVFLMPLLASFALKHIKGPAPDEPGEDATPRKDDI